MQLHIAITGASGFIGAAAAAELIKSGHRVTALLRPESNPVRLISSPSVERFEYHNLADLKKFTALKHLKPDVFVHCGWRGVGGDDRNGDFQITENIQMSMNSVGLAAYLGCRHWIGLGSQAEYGNQNCRLNEDASLRPTTLYGKAKLAAGIACLALAEAKGLSATWLRVFSTYGPGDSPKWFLQYVLNEFSAGRSPELTLCTQLWDYLHVSDAARAIAAVAATPTATGVFNLGSGIALPLRHWLELLRNAINCQIEPKYGVVPFRIDQVMHLEADISRLTFATGWKPLVSPTDGIASLVANNFAA